MDFIEAKESQELVRHDSYSRADESLITFLKESPADIMPSDQFWAQSIYSLKTNEFHEGYSGIVYFQRLNDIIRVNKFLEETNRNLAIGQYLTVNLETKDSRKIRILNKYPKIISYPHYILDFVLKRVFPKTKYTKKLYFAITKGKNRVLTLTEAMGRLKCCGFDTVSHKRIGYKTFILAKKVSDPIYDMEPTYGALVRLKRIGYKGKRIKLYKLRTMHPYSEYLQEVLFEKNGTSDGDKIVNDSRVTNWGKIFRKFWIDELPMLWNWLKGDLKLVGVRPLSEHKFYTYPEYLQKKRIQIKPGLVPPFYADLPKTPEDFFQSEERYLDLYSEKPIRTDIRYFFKAMYNIFIKRARSN